MICISPIKPTTFKASNILRGASRAFTLCVVFLLVLIQGNPFALWAHCNGASNSLLRAGCLTTGSRGAFLFHSMSNIQTKRDLLDKIGELERKLNHERLMHSLTQDSERTNVNIAKLTQQALEREQALNRAYSKVFSITPAEAKAIQTVASILERLHNSSFIKPLNQ